ncbi:NAD(P)-dependent alcohol dehydrogenase [Saccharopolyspora sp. NPDC002578]
MRVTAAVARDEGQPFMLEELELDSPRPDEVLVEVHAVGLCRTDISLRDQWMRIPLPAVLGHEGAGVVARVGADVTKVRPGDKVVMTFGSCGRCRYCESGHPAYCVELLERNVSGSRPDGTNALHCDVEHGEMHGFFISQSSFATHAIASERSIVRVADDTDLEMAGPIGCGIQTGAGAVINRLRPEAGSAIAVFGVGAVGMAAVMAARLVGCATIIAVDVQPDRLDLARELGATHLIDAGRVNPVSAIQTITDGGVAYTVETTAVPEVARQAVYSLAPLGTCAILGLGPAGAELSIDMTNLLLPGRTVTGVTWGDSRPDELIPQLLELHGQGRFPVDRLIDTYSLMDINKAVEDLEVGKCLKAVLKPCSLPARGMSAAGQEKHNRQVRMADAITAGWPKIA